MSTIGDKSILSATVNFETVLSSLEMRCEQSLSCLDPVSNLQIGLVCKPVYTADRTGQNYSVSNIMRTTENSLTDSLVGGVDELHLICEAASPHQPT